MSNALRLTSISKAFTQADSPLEVLKDISLEVAEGETVALLGASGSGKTTLLQIAGLLSSPDRGEVWLQEVNASNAGDRQRTLLRRDKIGFIYQFHHLLPEFTALENVVIPQRIAEKSASDAHKYATELLEALGLKDRLQHRPSQLSGGEQQRVAIARAMANRPALILADEPTGNLDHENAAQTFAALKAMIAEHKTSLLMATHDTKLAEQADRMIRLHSGSLAAN